MASPDAVMRRKRAARKAAGKKTAGTLLRQIGREIGKKSTPRIRPASTKGSTNAKPNRRPTSRYRPQPKNPESPQYREAVRDIYAAQPHGRRKELVRDHKDNAAGRALRGLNKDRARATRAVKAFTEVEGRIARLPPAEQSQGAKDILARLSPGRRRLVVKGGRVLDRRHEKDTLRNAMSVPARTRRLQPVVEKDTNPIADVIGRIAGGLAGGKVGVGAQRGMATKAVQEKIAEEATPAVRATMAPLNRALKELTRGASATAGAAEAITSGKPQDALKAGWKGLVDNDRSWEEVARDIGMDGNDAQFAGLMGDIFGDPITYLTLGAAGVGKAAATKAGRQAARRVEVDVVKAQRQAKKRGITLTDGDIERLQQYARRTIDDAQLAARKKAEQKKTVARKRVGERKGLQVGVIYPSARRTAEGKVRPTVRERTVNVVTTPAPVSAAARKVANSPAGRLSEKLKPSQMPSSWRAAGLTADDFTRFREDLRVGRAKAVQLEREMGHLARLVRSVGGEDEFRRIYYAIEKGDRSALTAKENTAAEAILKQMATVRSRFAEYGVRVELVDTVTPAVDLEKLLGGAKKASRSAKQSVRANIRVLGAVAEGRKKRITALRMHGNMSRNPQVREARKEVDGVRRLERRGEQLVYRTQVDGARAEASLLRRLNGVTKRVERDKASLAAAEKNLKARAQKLDVPARALDSTADDVAAREQQIDHLEGFLYDKKVSPELIPTIERLEKELSDLRRHMSSTRPARERAEKARNKYDLSRAELDEALEELRALREEAASSTRSARDRVSDLRGQRVEAEAVLKDRYKQFGAVSDRDIEGLFRARARSTEAREKQARIRAFDDTLKAGRPVTYERELQFLEDVFELATLVGRDKLAARAFRALERARTNVPPVDYIPRKPVERLLELLERGSGRGAAGKLPSQSTPGNLKGRLERRRIEAVDAEKPGYYSMDMPLIIGLYGPQVGQRLGAVHFFSRVMNRHAAPVSEEALAAGGVAWRAGDGGRPYTRLAAEEQRALRKAVENGEAPPEGVFLLPEAVSDSVAPALAAISPDEFLNAIDKTTRGFKMMNTIMRPGFFVNTSVGNLWQLYLRDSLFTADFTRGAKAFAAMRAAERSSQKVGGRAISRYVDRVLGKATVKVDGVRIPLSRLIDEMIEAGAIRAGSRVNDPTELSAFTDAARNARRRVRPLAAAGQLAEDMDDITKTILYLRGRGRGLGPQDSVAYSLTGMIDYGDLTAFERQVMRRLMPFYVFTARNLPIQIRGVLARPGKAANYEKVRQEIAQLAGLPEDWELNLREADQERLPWAIPGYTPTSKDGTPIQAFQYLRLPFDDLQRPALLAGRDPMRVGQRYLADISPLIKWIFEIPSNKRFDYDRPLEDPEYPKIVAGPVGRLLSLLGAGKDADPYGNEGTVIDGRLDYLMRLPGSYSAATLSSMRPAGEVGGTRRGPRLVSSLLLGQGHNAPDPRDTTRDLLRLEIDRVKRKQARMKEKSEEWYAAEDTLNDLYDERTRVRADLGWLNSQDGAAELQRKSVLERLGIAGDQLTPAERVARDELNVVRKKLGMRPR